jgi:hypothetical protein
LGLGRLVILSSYRNSEVWIWIGVMCLAVLFLIGVLLGALRSGDSRETRAQQHGEKVGAWAARP